MRKQKFTLVLGSVCEITSKLANALYAATGGGIEFSMCNGVAVLEFERVAPSLQSAIVSAIRQVEGATESIRVVRVESEATPLPR